MSMTGKEMKICLPLYKVLYSLASAAWGSRIRDVLPVSGSLSAVRSRDRRRE